LPRIKQATNEVSDDLPIGHKKSTLMVLSLVARAELSKNRYALKYRPWFVAHVEFFNSKKEAIKRERFLKSGQGRKWIKTNLFGGRLSA